MASVRNYTSLDPKYYMPVLSDLPALPEQARAYEDVLSVQKNIMGSTVFGWTLERAKALKPDASQQFVCIAVGGDGVHEMALARYGFDAVVVGNASVKNTVDLRNEYLYAENEEVRTDEYLFAKGGMNGTMDFCEAGIRNIDSAFLENVCMGRELKVVMVHDNAFRQLDKDALARFFKAVANVASERAVLSISFEPSEEGVSTNETPIFNHRPRIIINMAHEANFIFAHKASNMSAGQEVVEGLAFRLRQGHSAPRI
ncbi:MAG: hypothetical protein WC464_06550 [Bdellovibrionales bacterium]